MKTQENPVVKVGDKLAFRNDVRTLHMLYGRWEIAEVERITPAGFIVMSNGKKLNPDLTIRGRHPYSQMPYRGEPVTPQIQEQFDKDRIVRKVRAGLDRINLVDLTMDQLSALMKVLERG